jgi:hypothetical protein
MNQTYDEHIERMLEREREAARKAQAARKAGSPEIEVECWRAAQEWCERRLALRESEAAVRELVARRRNA